MMRSSFSSPSSRMSYFPPLLLHLFSFSPSFPSLRKLSLYWQILLVIKIAILQFCLRRFQHLHDFKIKRFLCVFKMYFRVFAWLQGSCWEWLSPLLAEQSDSITRRQWWPRYCSALTGFALCFLVCKPCDYFKLEVLYALRIPTGLCMLRPFVVRQNSISHCVPPLFSSPWVKMKDIILMDSMRPWADVFILLTLYFSLTSLQSRRPLPHVYG